VSAAAQSTTPIPLQIVRTGVQPDDLVHVYVSATGLGNFNAPPSGVNGLREFDYKSNAATFDVAELSVGRATVAPGRFGVRFDLSVGETVPLVTAASGLFRDAETGQAKHVDIPQAYLRYVAPVGANGSTPRLEFDAGKFLAPLGLESIETWDHVMDNASRSILFTYATPLTLTGGRISYVASPKVSAQGFVVVGWDRVTDNNTGKTVGGQLTLAPTEHVSVSLGAMNGPEQKNNTTNERTIFDLILTWQVTARTRFSLNGDEGREAHASPTGGHGDWHGWAAYLQHTFSPLFGLALRGELFHDVNGARTGVSQQVGEFTVTPTFTVGHGLSVRGELRIDRSDTAVFDSTTGLQKSQGAVAVNVVWIK
jgi:hypothetical protein